VSKKTQWIDETENGIKFKDITVPSYDRVVATIEKIHGRMPYFGIVGWDIAVDKDGDPVLIEFNLRPGQNQIGCKAPTFGDMTEEVLDEVFIKKTLKGKFIYSNI
jgi:D-alanine-D-alanine ligase-like ATP-grasp enzyme